MLENSGGPYLGPDPERTKGALFLIYSRIIRRVQEAEAAERQGAEMGEPAQVLGGDKAGSVGGGAKV